MRRMAPAKYWCCRSPQEAQKEPTMKTERPGIKPDVPPSGEGCVECLAAGGWWLHLRRCAECGHVGCCDSSPSQHASKHFNATSHPIAASFEPGETWFYDYGNRKMIPGERFSPLVSRVSYKLLKTRSQESTCSQESQPVCTKRVQGFGQIRSSWRGFLAEAEPHATAFFGG